MAKILPLQSVAFGSVGAGYGTAATYTDPISQLTIISTLDQPALISFNASADHLLITAGQERTIDPDDVGAFLNGVVSVKRDSAAPTVGKIVFEAMSKD